MGANPISYSELEAFERKAGVRFTIWEAEVLMRIDDAVIEAWGKKAKAESGKDKPEQTQIPAENTPGVRSLFRGLAARTAQR